LYSENNFVDPQGFLTLSESLESNFSCWKRPREFLKNTVTPLVIKDIIKPNQIKQTQVGNTSYF